MIVTRRFSDPEATWRLDDVAMKSLRRLLALRAEGYARLAVQDQLRLDEDIDHAYSLARSRGLADQANLVLRQHFPRQPEAVAGRPFWCEAGRVLVDIATRVRPDAGDVSGLHEELYIIDDGTKSGFWMSQLARLLRERVARYRQMQDHERQALDALIEELAAKALRCVLDLDVQWLLHLAGCEREFMHVKPAPRAEVGFAPLQTKPFGDHEWTRKLGEVHLDTLIELIKLRGDWYDKLCLDDQLRIDWDIDRAFQRCRRFGLEYAALWHAREAVKTQPEPATLLYWWNRAQAQVDAQAAR